MATFTKTSFNNMLKEYMPYELLMEEVMKRDYFLGKVNKKMNWKGGEMQVPFMGAYASSISYGQLTAEADITEDLHVRGKVSGYKEVWGSMIFNDHDLAQHGTEQSFIKILPNKLEMFIDSMKQAVSVNLLNGAHLVSLVIGAPGENLIGGIVAVDRPARLTIGQYVEVGIVGLPAPRAVGYIKSITIDGKLAEIVVNKDLSGGAVDLGAAGVIAGDKFFVRGGSTAANAFTSLRDQLLSPANLGSATLFGESKLAYPHLQAPNISGSLMTSVNILELVFDAYNKTRTLGKGNPTDVIMSYDKLGAAMKSLDLGGARSGSAAGESSTGFGRGFSVTDRKVNAFGWTEITISGVKGSLTFVGVQEMDDDIMFFMDWRAVDLHSNGFFERRVSPEGNHFFEIRNTNGYQYIVDTRFFGELVASKPSHCGVMYGIPATLV